MKHKVSHFFSHKRVQLIGVALVAIIATSLLILFTQLRYSAVPPLAMQEIQPKALYEAVQANPEKYLLIDVRPADIYNFSHVKGSINIGVPDIYSEKTAIPRTGKTVVLICGDGRSAAVVYGYLRYQGFPNLLHLTGGFNNWASKNLPIASTTSN